MTDLPRLALATPANGSEPAPASLAMMAGLEARRWSVQHFRAWAGPTGSKLINQVSGRPGRHLDSWLMPPRRACDVFVRGARGSSLAIVEGTLDDPLPPNQTDVCDRPGAVSPLVEMLQLPVLAVVDCHALTNLHLPWVPPQADAVLLDGLECRERFEALRGLVGYVLKKPVIGAVEALPGVRGAIASSPPDQEVPRECVAPLGESFLRFADLDALRSLAVSRPFPHAVEEPPPFSACEHLRFRVAYAMDEAFGAYFPDTLEALESLGAELREFSPLRSESLPEDVDLVMIGCGFPDCHAQDLAANVSLISAIRNFVCRGGRLYAESGGTAYLSRTMVIDGMTVPGAGIFPIRAERIGLPAIPSAIERTLNRASWLGPSGLVVRGYCSGRWAFHPDLEPDDCPARSGFLNPERDLIFRKGAIGSRIHLHLGALPNVVSAFAGRPVIQVGPQGDRP
jgi:cobyrinic acid a,c-diamide synthase